MNKIGLKHVMAKTLLVIFFFFTLKQEGLSQYQASWKKAHLTFETKEQVRRYFTFNFNAFDADNESMGISIERVSFKKESAEFLGDVQYACKEICENMKLEVLDEGENFMEDSESYYVICNGEQTLITAVVLREDIEKAFEIAIYCNEIDVAEGLDVLYSLSFLK